MATFQYKAYTAQGVVTAGTIVAEGVDAAIDACTDRVSRRSRPTEYPMRRPIVPIRVP